MDKRGAQDVAEAKRVWHGHSVGSAHALAARGIRGVELRARERQVRAEFELFSEFDGMRELGRERAAAKGEALEVHGEQLRRHVDCEPLLRVDFGATGGALVRVRASEALGRRKSAHSRLDSVATRGQLEGERLSHVASVAARVAHEAAHAREEAATKELAKGKRAVGKRRRDERRCRGANSGRGGRMRGRR